MVAFVRRINLRHWTLHKLRTSLTLLGVTVGVMLVVAVASVNSTFLSAVEDTARRLGADADLEVAAPDRTGIPEAAVGEIVRTEGVGAVSPVVRSYTSASGDAGETRMLFLGVTPEFELLLRSFTRDELSISTMSEIHDSVFLSRQTADRLGVDVGDAIEVDAHGGSRFVTVGGFFAGSSVEALGAGDVGVLALPVAQELFGRVGHVDSVYVLAEPDAELDTLQAGLERALPPGTIVGAPGTRAQGFQEALNGIASLSSLAGTVALFVAAFVVFNSVAMSVRERRREISLSLALGATRKQVLAGFVGEAAVLGAIACAVGVPGGYFLARELVQPGLDGLRVFAITAVADPAFGWGQAILGSVAGLGVSILASYLPARRILQVAPVESLRPAAPYEDQAESDGSRRRLVTTVAGVVILVTVGIVGLVHQSSLDNAAWTTSAALVSLLIGLTFVLPAVVPAVIGFGRGLFSGSISMRLGLDGLMRNARRTTLTVGALVFTLGIVVGVGGALDSYEAQWRRSANEWYGGPILLAPDSFETLGADQPLPAALGDRLERLPEVAESYPVRFRIVYVDGRQTTIYALSYAEGMDDPAVRASGGQGFRDRIARIQQRGEVVISAQTRKKKGVDIGDELVLPTPSGEVSFKVGGVMHDLNPLDSVFLSADMFLEHWKDDRVDSFALSPADGYSQSEAIAAVDRVMEERGIAATVWTKDGLIERTFAPISELFSVARAIQLAALIVAAMAIANTMFVTVMERRWELGLQKAVGMDDRSMVKMLLSEAGAIGVTGSLLAWAAGIGMGYLMITDMQRSYSFAFPFEIPFDLMLLTLTVGSVIALIAGAVPSRKASRVPIVESLRFE